MPISCLDIRLNDSHVSQRKIITPKQKNPAESEPGHQVEDLGKRQNIEKLSNLFAGNAKGTCKKDIIDA